MLRAPSRYYLYCQSVGWGMLLMIYIASGLLIFHQETIKSLENAFITALTGLFMTHLLRLAILKEKSATAGDAAVDIESITRSLDRIRSLIAEDAAAARAEITVFSQLLRKGYLKINDPQ